MPRTTPIYYLQSMNYFVPNRILEQEHLYNLFNNSNIQFSSHENHNENTGILPYNKYYSSGPCVESAYDVYRLRIMPQSPNLIATRSYHEDIAIYWLNYNHLPKPLNAFKNKNKNNIIPERAGNTAFDNNNSLKRKRRIIRNDNNNNHPTKKQKLNNNNINTIMDEDSGSDSDSDSIIDVTVGTDSGYLVAVGQTSSKTKTGWGLSFNKQHSGMFITGNNDGSIVLGFKYD